MKALFLLLVGAVAGAFAFSCYQQSNKPVPPPAAPAPAPASSSPSLSQRAADDARAAKDAVADKLTQWHLTPEDIKSDLARTGQVVRTKAQAVGSTLSSKTSNARIVTVIKAKYTVDSELSSRSIEVDCDNGTVTLRGTVSSPGLIAKAVGIALETDGVNKVDSRLTVAEKTN